jgi:hypothetical protein
VISSKSRIEQKSIRDEKEQILIAMVSNLFLKGENDFNGKKTTHQINKNLNIESRGPQAIKIKNK